MSPSLSLHATSTQDQTPQRSWLGHVKMGARAVAHHAKKHTGVGIVCAVAYFDPGNWGVDLQAGSQFGYRLLFVVLLAGLFAVFLQVLCSRLGCVTGLDLASHCRLLLHDRPKHTLLYRWLGLYPLYVLAEVAIISTDLAELLGSAIALCMLFPTLQLWQGVLLTGFDVFVLLALGDPLRGKPVKMFELLIAALVIAVLTCMGIIIGKVQPVWSDAFIGFIPSKYIFHHGGLYTSVGILGATVMPHSLFLGSALATQDRISYHKKLAMAEAAAKLASMPIRDPEQDKFSIHSEVTIPRISGLRRSLYEIKESVLKQFRMPPPSSHSSGAKRHSDRENNPLPFIRAQIYHGIVDVVLSLLGFALMINSMITILAAAVFFYGRSPADTGRHAAPASLFDAYDLINDLVGTPAAKLFAVALLAAGQSSSIIATVSGQAVAEGYLHWRVSPVIRRMLTRLLAIIPAMIVAAAVGRAGIDVLLVASQVVLSITLPFITFPLIYCTSSKSIMRVRVPPSEDKPGFQTPISISPTPMPMPIPSTPTPTPTLTPTPSPTPTPTSTPAENSRPSTQLPESPSIDSSNGGTLLNTTPDSSQADGITELARPQASITSAEKALPDRWVDFSNSIYTTLLGGVIWTIIVAANFYVIVALAMGNGM